MPVNTYYFKIMFDDADDAVDVAAAISNLIPDRIQNVTLHDTGIHSVYLEIIGVNGMRQWKQYIAPFINEDATDSPYFILSESLTLIKKPAPVKPLYPIVKPSPPLSVNDAVVSLRECGLSESFLNYNN